MFYKCRCRVNAKNLYISPVTRKLFLIFFFHDRLYFRHLHSIGFHHEEGICERFFIKLTMPALIQAWDLARSVPPGGPSRAMRRCI